MIVRRYLYELKMCYKILFYKYLLPSSEMVKDGIVGMFDFAVALVVALILPIAIIFCIPSKEEQNG